METSIQEDINLETQNIKDIIGSEESGEGVTERPYQRVCFSSIWILVALAPVIIFILIYFIEPGFIQKKEGNNYVIDNRKLWGYWALFTFIIWVLLLMYAYSRGYKSNLELCM